MFSRVGSSVLLCLGLVACAPEAERAEDTAATDSSVLVDELGRQPLPNWETPLEAEQARIAPRPQSRATSAKPTGSFRIPAEYEPVETVVMTWATFTPMLQGIASAVASTGANVWAVGGPTSVPGVPAARYRSLPFRYDSVWVRDYGPVGLDEETNELGIVDSTYRHFATRTRDDAIPCSIAQTAGANCYRTELILDGGNFLTDGKGNVFFTTRLYEWNSDKSHEEVDQLLRDYYGAINLHRFEYAKRGSQPADGTGHLDTFVKLLGDCTVLVTETADEPFRSTAEAAATYFANLTCPTGAKYDVHRVPGHVRNGVWYAYTNSLIVNKTVVVPSFSSGDNARVKEVYQNALPGYSVVLVPSDDSIRLGGAIHCVTQTIPAGATLKGNQG